MATEDDKWLYLIIGGIGGIVIGIILSKFLNLQQAQTQETKIIYGYNYSYDEAGHLTSYIPVPLPITVSGEPVQVAKSAEKKLSIESLLA